MEIFLTKDGHTIHGDEHSGSNIDGRRENLQNGQGAELNTHTHYLLLLLLCEDHLAVRAIPVLVLQGFCAVGTDRAVDRVRRGVVGHR